MKKIITSLVAIVVLMSCLAPCALASYEEQHIEIEDISPRYAVINYITASLAISDSGRASCGASAGVLPGYRVEILSELQQQNGARWTTIHDWSSSGSNRVEVSGPWYVMAGYSYRLKVTVTVYDSNGNFVEAPVEYSKVQEC